MGGQEKVVPLRPEAAAWPEASEPAGESSTGLPAGGIAITPRRTRGGGTPIPLQLTSRDLAVLQAVNRYRYLKTSQIQRLLFPDAATLQTTRRRLRKLAHPAWGYLERISGTAQAGDGRPEMAFALGKEGAAILTGMGETLVPYPRSRPAGGGRHLYLEHALGISEFRVCLELALREHPAIRLQRFVQEDELKTHLRRGIKKDAYKLYHRLPHPRTQREYVVHPDALIVLAARGQPALDKQKKQRLFFLEVDRGKESLRILRDKVIGYQLFRQSGTFRKFGDFADFLVLLVTNSERRVRNLREALTDVPGEADVWIAQDIQISKTTVLKGAVWLDHTGHQRCSPRVAPAVSPSALLSLALVPVWVPFVSAAATPSTCWTLRLRLSLSFSLSLAECERLVFFCSVSLRCICSAWAFVSVAGALIAAKASCERPAVSPALKASAAPVPSPSVSVSPRLRLFPALWPRLAPVASAAEWESMCEVFSPRLWARARAWVRVSVKLSDSDSPLLSVVL